MTQLSFDLRDILRGLRRDRAYTATVVVTLALTIGATTWCIEKGVVIVGYDFYHGNDEPDSPRVFHNSRTLSEHGIITMPYLKNLDRIEKDRFTLIGLPLKMIGAEASPVRAVAVY